MEDIFKSISRYNILNYLIPGTIFCAILRMTTSYDLVQAELAIGLFLYYFVGIVISRIGSLIVEPILMKIKLVKHAQYENFIAASKKDQKIELLSETNNTYRTLLAMLLVLGLAGIADWFVAKFEIPSSIQFFTLIVILIVLFIASYSKQTAYINKRVKVGFDKQNK